jgi:hypothetical protein
MRYRSVAVVFLTLFLSSFGTGYAEKPGHDFSIPSVSRSLLTQRPITLGDPIDVALNIYHRKKDAVAFPEKTEYFLPFILKDMTVKKSRGRENSSKTMVLYTFTIFDTGTFTLPSFKTTVGKEVIETEPLEISVLSVLPKDGEQPALKDIVGPYRSKIRPLMLLIIFSSIIGAAVLLYFVFRIIMGRKSEVVHEMVIPEGVDPYEFSITELNQLKKAFREHESETGPAYTTISFVLRFFIGAVYHFNAPQMTTGEIRRYMRTQDQYTVPRSELVDILKRSDMVKFAKEQTGNKQTEDDITGSIGIINEIHTSFLKIEEQATDEL